MTQVTLEQHGVIKKNKLDKKSSAINQADVPKCISNTCIQVCAWVLLTLGMCIIISTFYLAIRQRNYENTDGSDKVFKEFNKNEKSFDMNMIGIISRKISGCHEKYCKVLCSQAADIYISLNDTLLFSQCGAADVLIISNQDFPDGLFRNAWIPVPDTTVHEFMLMASNVSVIKNGAFNSVFFSTTYRMAWTKLNLRLVEGGALLGLHQLKHLTIETAISALDRAFFQPVQTTLISLLLHAGLTVAKGKHIFGISNLNKLEYADLSRNRFEGSIEKDMFLATPNLKYLLMKESHIKAIADDAFVNLVNKLQMLDLSQNHLTTINSGTIQPLLTSSTRTFISLTANSFICDCNIESLRYTYTAYRSQFVEDLHCKAPHNLYGTALDQVNLLDLGCETDATDSSTITDSLEVHSTTTSLPKLDEGNPSNEMQENEFFEMRCMQMLEADGIIPSRSLTPSFYNVNFSQSKVINWNDWVPDSDSEPGVNPNLQEDLDYFQFEPPEHDFELHLVGNCSVNVSIADFDAASPVNIIWFSEKMEDLDSTYAGATIDYDCMGYIAPYLIIDGLAANTTYTFCLMPNAEYTITPFNCLPLHVPRVVPADVDDTWISKDSKQFTVGILCLIFLLSTFFGAVVAYFGIKSYPDLLEGSKNVLVVKKSDQTCYVSTISETEYLKKSSIKKKPLGSGSMKKHSLQPALPDTPTPISVAHLERLCSMKSSSTLFEDAFVPIAYPEDEYEMPKKFEKTPYHCEERGVPNNYAMSPALPPPLPKRNSEVAESLNLVINRFVKPN